MPEVIGRLLTKKNLQLGVIDTLSGGLLTQDLIDAGFGDLITANLHTIDTSAALQKAGLASKLTHGTGITARLPWAWRTTSLRPMASDLR